MTDSFFEHETKGEPSGKVPDLEDNTPRGSSTGSARDEGFSTDEGRMAAVMSYIPILCFIPLLSMKDNKEAHFHARQGVVLFLIELIAVIFLIDGISDLVFKGILIVAIALSVAGIYFALQGRNYRLPVIGDLADKTKAYTDPDE